MIKPYLEKMSNSEILLVMSGGMATMAGGVLAAYIALLGGMTSATAGVCQTSACCFGNGSTRCHRFFQNADSAN